MRVFEIVIALLLGGAALAALARRFGAPYPALVAFAGAGLALIPGVPTIVLDPELALALFVAPVLVDAAFDSSPRDLRANWRAVASLALGAVALTIAVVAVIARLLVPDMPWAAAIALGAIVAPPDAAAATTVLKQLRPPHRLLVILEGESLFNDASALLVYRLAVGATIAGVLSGWSVLPTLLVVTVGSVVLGLVLSRLTLAVNARINDVATAVVVQFCGTFAVWLLAERLHLSGIITLVVFAMAAARRVPEIVPARIRIPSWAVWEVAVFVLNVLAFILVGFQLKSIVERATGATGTRYAAVAAAVCVAVILARIAWVTGAAAFSRWRCPPRPDGKPGPQDAVALTARGAAVVGWCGMRGTVTLAAALALPTGSQGGVPFPYRDLILVTAFGVVLGTLVFQGLTLRPLLLRLRLEDDGTVDREVRFARVETLRAAVEAAAAGPRAETAELVRHRYELQLRRAEEDLGAPEKVAASAADTDGQKADGLVVRAVTEAARRRLVALRADGTIGDAAFQRVEEELDWADLDWAQFLRTAGGEG
ncbi:MAG: monovalent cation/hydrogen antiporter [Acidobacteriota bacterium]|jgi:CPA1 family monovalent cation:H+ antiporter|nr:monovalent cation/hydrogen antiporter [Acidobacteriota bacterium]